MMKTCGTCNNWKRDAQYTSEGTCLCFERAVTREHHTCQKSTFERYPSIYRPRNPGGHPVKKKKLERLVRIENQRMASVALLLCELDPQERRRRNKKNKAAKVARQATRAGRKK